MKRLFGAMGLCVLAVAAQGSEVLREISWALQEQQGALLAGEVHPADDSAAFEYLEVKNAEPGGRTITLLKLERPGITKARYALVGEVRCEGVDGAAYLEMWAPSPWGS